ncbi:MAG: Chaperone protein DnaK [Bacteroidia bacterium]|nr:Chaperone protein DnaK [Bacteroidia bacterium]MBX3107399.1 Hsp70 family protein [Bacteroidota bacterium]
MPNELSIQQLLPEVNDRSVIENKIQGSTFIGIDFGTSTTVVSYAIVGDNNAPIKTNAIPIRQLNFDGNTLSHHLVPSCIAYQYNQLYFGQGAKMLKSKLQPDQNIWFSFKMNLGKDNGPEFTRTELKEGNPLGKIENTLDATKLFFKELKNEIDNYIQEQNLPRNLFYSVSIPASFEANQRADLKRALAFANIPINETLFIDEPNAAFLSYLVQANNNGFNNYNIPVDSPLHILVFDFGAGTCDISIIEIGRKAGKLYSKNIAISQFEQLGGDDIDRAIVKEILLPQLAKQNNISVEEIRENNYKKILLPKLQAVAEQLKIKVCKAVASNKVGQELPNLINSTERIYFLQTIDFILPKQVMKFENPSISPKEFTDIMNKFTSETLAFNFQDDVESLKSIFTVINSALLKANIEKGDIDLVLLIGGSSYNPYIQTALYRHFDNSDIEIPQDLQSHVSNGTAINSFMTNGLGVDIIKPIVSEPIFIILQNDVKKTVVYEGTEIPCKEILIEDLRPQRNDQKEIEIPICVSTKDKILTILKLKSENGFSLTDKITLKCGISHDKLITFRAFIQNLEISTEPLNPFANSALSTEDIAEKQLLRLLYKATKENGGKPPLDKLKALSQFYVKTERHLKAAETFENIQQLDPNRRYETSICYHYAEAGRKKLSDNWAEIAYQKNPTSTNAYNLALTKSLQGRIDEYKKLMEEAVTLGSDAAMLTYGEYLLDSEKQRAEELIQKAFDIWYKEFESNKLSKNDFSRLIRAAKQLGKIQIAEQVQKAKDNLKDENGISWYNPENTATDGKEQLESKNINYLN